MVEIEYQTTIEGISKENISKKEQKNTKTKETTIEKKSTKNNTKKTETKKEKKQQKKPNKKAKLKLLKIVLSIVIASLVISSIGMFLRKPQDKVVAIINGEPVTEEYLEKRYQLNVPLYYQSFITKKDFLNTTLTNNILLIQEADKIGIKENKTLVDNTIEILLYENNFTKKELISNLKDIGLTLEDLEEIYMEQSKIVGFVDIIISPNIEVSSKEVEDYYNKNKEMLNITFEEIKEDIANYLFQEKQAKTLEIYLSQLRAKADIEIISEENKTFKLTNDAVCKENNKTTIRLYTTTQDIHSKWIGETFDDVVKDYDVIAYHWQLDTGDNILTEKIETSLPKSEIDIFKKYSPNGAYPLFVFGCKYIRIGNGYKQENSLIKERTEMIEIIENLIQS